MMLKVIKKVSLFLACLASFSCSFSTTSIRKNAFTNSFIKARGNKFVDESGNEYEIRGMNFSNNAYFSTDFVSAFGMDHDENSYKELSELGFNTVRYYLNYRMFSIYNQKDDKTNKNSNKRTNYSRNN